MGKRRYQRKIESLEERIREHQEKIGRETERETEKDKPDEGPIAHWEREIRVFREGVRKAKKRRGEKG